MTDDQRDTPETGVSYDRDTTSSADKTASDPDTSVDPGSDQDDLADTDPEDQTADSDDESADSRSVTDVETIALDPETVLDTLAYNGQEDLGPEGKAVFTLSPPFGKTVEPTLRHLGVDSTESKADDEIHIRPFRFVTEGRQVIDQRPTRQLAKEELDEDDPDEAAIEAWIDEALETWKAHVSENLVETVDIYSSHGMAFIDVEYRRGEA